jgi:hypothetical protein
VQLGTEGTLPACPPRYCIMFGGLIILVKQMAF